MNAWSRRFWVLVLCTVAASAGCKKGAKPTPGETASITVRPDSTGIYFYWIDDHGVFHAEDAPSKVPEAAREVVLVVDPTREEGTSRGKVLLADLRETKPDGTYAVRLTDREELDKVVVLRRQEHGPTLSGSAKPKPPKPKPDAPERQDEPASTGGPDVIIYGAEWCGPCHEAERYVKRRGVSYEKKDIEADPEAGKEMRQKLLKAGIRTASIPIIDVRGKILVGFSAAAVDEALGEKM